MAGHVTGRKQWIVVFHREDDSTSDEATDKVFYLSGLSHNQHPKVEVHSLGRLISVIVYSPGVPDHPPYMLVDR